MLLLLPPFEREPPPNDAPPLLREPPNELREPNEELLLEREPLPNEYPFEREPLPNEDELLRLLLPNEGLDWFDVLGRVNVLRGVLYTSSPPRREPNCPRLVLLSFNCCLTVVRVLLPREPNELC